MKKLMSLFLVFVLAELLLVGCGEPVASGTPKPSTSAVTPTATSAPRPTAISTPAASGAPQYGGVLKIILRQAPSSLFPARMSAGTVEYARPAFEGLVRFNDKGEVIGMLASDWKYSADFKTITFTLRKGVKFHDGTDFNAAAAKYNLDARRASKLGDLDSVSSVDVVDDNTIRLNLSAPDTTLMLSLSQVSSWVGSPTAFQTLGQDKSLFSPVGTGPFRFVDYQMGVRARYERFDGYRVTGRPYLDGMEYQIVADATTANLSFQTAAAQAMGETDIKDTNDLMQKGGFNVYAPTDYITVMCPDTVNADSPFSRKGVREAVDYAIDSQAIAKSVGYGLWEGPKQMATSKMVAYVDGMGRQYDPAKAKQALADAGYPSGFKTTLWARTVAPQAALQAVQAYLKAVGIDMELKFVDTATFAQIGQQGGWKNGILNQAVVTPGRTAPEWLKNVSTILSATSIEAKSLQRPSAWQDLLTKALANTDPAGQKAMAQQLNKLNYDEAMVIIPYVYARGYLTTKAVHDMDWFGTNYSKPYVADTWLGK